MRDKFREMVAYLLKSAPTDDDETIDNYTDSIMLGAEEYHQSKVKTLFNDFKKEELPNAEAAFHYESEMWSGMQRFLEWMKNKEN